MSPRLAFALESAYLAGRSTLAWFGTTHDAELKGDGSPVTVADRAAEQVLRSRIEKEYPGELILGEEFGGSDFQTGWLLDPIDGTKSFLSGVPLYSTLISFESDGETLIAAAYFPAIDEMVFAEKGAGCFLNGRPVRVSQKDDLKLATICCGGLASVERSGRLPGVLNLAEKALTARTWCDAFGHCLVATGRAEAMIDPIVSRWDTSSVRLLVAEAGGRATDFAGNDFPTTEIISCNSALFSEVLGAFQA